MRSLAHFLSGTGRHTKLLRNAVGTQTWSFRQQADLLESSESCMAEHCSVFCKQPENDEPIFIKRQIASKQEYQWSIQARISAIRKEMGALSGG